MCRRAAQGREMGHENVASVALGSARERERGRSGRCSFAPSACLLVVLCACCTRRGASVGLKRYYLGYEYDSLMTLRTRGRRGRVFGVFAIDSRCHDEVECMQ